MTGKQNRRRPTYIQFYSLSSNFRLKNSPPYRIFPPQSLSSAKNQTTGATFARFSRHLTKSQMIVNKEYPISCIKVFNVNERIKTFEGTPRIFITAKPSSCIYRYYRYWWRSRIAETKICNYKWTWCTVFPQFLNLHLCHPHFHIHRVARVDKYFVWLGHFL